MFTEQDLDDALDIWHRMCEEDDLFYSTCTECQNEITFEEDNNNLGMCDLCYKETRYM